MAVTAPVRVERPGPRVVRAVMGDAATRNRLDEDLAGALTDALTRAEGEPGVEVFVLGSDGPAFCSGLALGDLDPGAADWRPRLAAIRDLFDRLGGSPLVTVAAVNGPATGGGVGLAAACDQVLVGPDGGFRLTEVLLGLVPAVVLPWLARRTGPHPAFSLALTAREVGGAEAVRLGLADAWSADPDRELRRLLVSLRGADPAATAELKRYRDALFTPPPGQAALIDDTLERRLADPRVRERLALFRRQGLLP